METFPELGIRAPGESFVPARIVPSPFDILGSSKSWKAGGKMGLCENSAENPRSLQ